MTMRTTSYHSVISNPQMLKLEEILFSVCRRSPGHYVDFQKLNGEHFG